MSLRLKITGMSCAHCQKAVREALESLEGVNSASVSLEEGVAEVSFDPELVGPDEMKKAIEEEGYTVEV